LVVRPSTAVSEGGGGEVGRAVVIYAFRRKFRSRR
jgi:hypothetical protein